MHPGTQVARRGFTLIELLLVMVILVVLAGIAVPIYIGRAKDARIQAAKADISNIESCLDTFELDNARSPTNEEGLAALIVQPANATDWKGPYLKKGLPLDPWGHPYNYRCPGTHNPATYDVWSNGPENQDGATDNIVNWQVGQ